MRLKIQKSSSDASTVYFFQSKGRIVSEVEVDYYLQGKKVEVDYYLQGKKTEGCICNVETRNSSRRRGLCTRLMKQLIEEHGDKSLFLTVSINSELGTQTMIRFYRKFGFKPDPNYPRTLRRTYKKEGLMGR